MPLLLLVVLLAVFFGFTNGLNDAANVVASLISTRTASPGRAVSVAGLFQIAGALLAGTAVADTFGTLVKVPA
ncbi:MAG TPA: inorganic phosphate transporter, partial [Acidimicrobiales bacterium]|nr:inorganic phosphate transporter [Acidimicrobiales bacterium]